MQNAELGIREEGKGGANSYFKHIKAPLSTVHCGQRPQALGPKVFSKARRLLFRHIRRIYRYREGRTKRYNGRAK